jgi:heme-degrading monooxygenase HmoA
MAVAPPFVAYSTLTEVLVPASDWPSVYASLQALKGHVQEYPGCQRFDVFVRAELDGDTRVHCYTTWDTPAQLEAFLERGYTFERLLADVGEDLEAERSLIMEKVF